MTVNRSRTSFLILVVCTALLLPMFDSPRLAQDGTGWVEVEIFVCPERADPFDSLDGLTRQCTVSADAVGILVSDSSALASTDSDGGGAMGPPTDLSIAFGRPA